jgi:hypothetical protein
MKLRRKQPRLTRAAELLSARLTFCHPDAPNLFSRRVPSTVYADVDASGGANPDNNFRFVGGFYVFNMSTKGLTTGGYYLYYRVGDDPTLHTAPFQIR